MKSHQWMGSSPTGNDDMSPREENTLWMDLAFSHLDQQSYHGALKLGFGISFESFYLS